MSNRLVGITFLLAVCTAVPVQAHHSFAASFTDEFTTVEGYVDDFKFNNPHVIVYFNVTDETGKVTRWMTEGGAATLLRRAGWDKDSLKKGDFISVYGNTSRTGAPMVSMEKLQLVDPKTHAVLPSPGEGVVVAEAPSATPLQLADGRPNLSGAWTMRSGPRNAGGPPGGPTRVLVGGPGAGAPPEGPGLVINNRPGGTGGPGGRGPSIPFNEAGAALQAAYDPKNDPQVQCKDPGLVRQAGFTPHPVRIQQFDDHVVISYEEYGGVRTIYFDDRDLVGGEKTNLGQSIARYDGQKLIVESKNLLGNLTGPNGNAITDQTTTVETYYRNADADGQSSLSMDMVITDPGYLTAPWTLSWTKYYNDNYDFVAVDCQVPLY